MFRLEDLKHDKPDQSDENDKSTIALEQPGFGDENQLENIRIYQGLSRRIQVLYATKRYTSASSFLSLCLFINVSRQGMGK